MKLNEVALLLEDFRTSNSNRIQFGDAGQQAVFRYIFHTYKNQFKDIQLISMAGKHSKRADIIMSFDGQGVRIEAKNMNTPTDPVTLYDRTVRRDQPHPDIDGIAAAITGNPNMTLVKLITRLRRKDKTIGFPGDAGVGASGKVTGVKMTGDDPGMRTVYRYILRHFAESGDSYFAINFGSSVTLYYTGFGKNILNAPKLPIPSYVELRTYGGAYNGGMRMAVKAKF